MPHYKDGTEAKVGDVVKGKGGYGAVDQIDIGVVTAIHPEATTCNMTVHRVASVIRHVPPNGHKVVIPRMFDRNVATCAEWEKIE